MLEQLLEYDTQLFVYLNGLGSETWDGFWLIITNKLSSIPLYVFLLVVVYKKYGWQKLLVIVLIIVGMITFTDQMTNVVKRSVLRFRPCACEEIMDSIRFIAERCSANRSLFSGHASNSMAAAVFGGLLLRPFFKNVIFILLFWAATVAYSRIYVGVHFPLDIICGMAFGALSGFGFYKLFDWLSKRLTILKS
ncbi:MAG: phosphatase PAP2 family protein [Winogradskyella sp.]|uniref:phosphatase PAP2 family protein n=1 Tax=Winogradskyella sp. TaxID=1883156 RepID=UPI0017CC4162|nr:phosphatase PAP2 family protein [Winogradskyella sp.]MBT8245478.1 phosphatase PAP2 family protein [Winogradskyella sp.]NNK23080.1 phosphatase PAP2 family protein [Winogradskyella sp.]